MFAQELQKIREWYHLVEMGEPFTPDFELVEALRRPDGSYSPQVIWEMVAGADRIRRSRKGMRIHTCTILNAKSGKCSEDCGFCSQSMHAQTDAPVYALLDDADIHAAAHASRTGGVDRFSVVTSGRGLPKAQVERLAHAMQTIGAPQPLENTQYCASLGILGEAELATLASAGVTRFHHNLETARSFFPTICTSHSYDERIATIKAAQKVGMSVCCGGIFGLGESDAQVLEFALELRNLGVDAVPVNFLLPVAGTRMQDAQRMPALRCLMILSLLRLVLPNTDILVCGGREGNLGELHPFIFQAGANGLMTGNYLTREGRDPARDKAMLDAMGFVHGLQ